MADDSRPCKCQEMSQKPKNLCAISRTEHLPNASGCHGFSMPSHALTSPECLQVSWLPAWTQTTAAETTHTIKNVSKHILFPLLFFLSCWGLNPGPRTTKTSAFYCWVTCSVRTWCIKNKHTEKNGFYQINRGSSKQNHLGVKGAL